MLTLSVSEKLALKAQAHALNPTVLVGAAGLTEAVLNEINVTLSKHGLIKVRVMAERAERDNMFMEICEQLDAAPVQHIGKTLVIYRPRPEGAEEVKKGGARRKPKRLTKKQMAGN